MKTVTIVTGNPNKVRELQAMAKGQIDFTMHDLDIDEIQSMDLEKIVRDKAQKAFAQIKEPVIVEDVSAGLISLNGMPGPFIKFFEKEIAGGALYRLTKADNERVVVTCIAAYYDGKQFIFGQGILHGTVVSPRGSNGFGFDPEIVPDGQDRTMAEMTTEEKSQISHRGKAFRALLEQLVK